MRVATSVTSARALGAPRARAVHRAPRIARSNRDRWIKRAFATTTTRDDAMRDDDDARVATIHVPSLVRRMRAIARRGNAIIREVTEGGDVGARDKGGAARADGTYVADAQTEADRRVEAMAIGALRAFSKDLNLVAEESFECAATIEAYAGGGGADDDRGSGGGGRGRGGRDVGAGTEKTDRGVEGGGVLRSVGWDERVRGG